MDNDWSLQSLSSLQMTDESGMFRLMGQRISSLMAMEPITLETPILTTIIRPFNMEHLSDAEQIRVA